MAEAKPLPLPLGVAVPETEPQLLALPDSVPVALPLAVDELV